LLTNIIRLATASAKSRLSNTIDKEDAIKAMELIIYSLQKQEVIKSDINGYKVDINKIENVMPKKNRDLMHTVIEVIKQTRNESKISSYDEILSGFKVMTGMSENDLVDCLNKLSSKGDIIEPRRGYYKVLE
jgi:replicative DNA helicase Mcm